MTPHRFPLTVYYEDTDMAGVVYYANYLRYIERAGRPLWKIWGWIRTRCANRALCLS